MDNLQMYSFAEMFLTSNPKAFSSQEVLQFTTDPTILY